MATNKDDFISKADMQVWSRFLHSDSGMSGLAYLRRAFRRSPENTDASLLRNAIGFESWHACIDAVEALGEVPPKQDKIETDELER